MTLVEVLSALPKDRQLIITATSGRTVGELLDRVPTLARAFQGRRVAIRLSDTIAGIEALAAADGRARSVTLLSPSLQDQHLKPLLALADCDLLLCDTPPTSDLPVDLVYQADRLALHATSDPSASAQTETAWHLATSGTTGVPKLVAHSLATLSRTAKRGNVESHRMRWGLLYDYTRFAGLQVVLQAIFAGSVLIVPPPTATLRDRLAMLAAQGCTHLSATPTLWRNIVMTPGAGSLPLRQVTLGGEIADARILSTLAATYPGARVTHIYASTEAGVGFAVKDGKAGFPASYLDTPPAGLALRVVDGRLQIKNTAVRSAYVGTGDRFGADDGWIDTGDNVEQSHDRIYFLGRASGIINVGGNKVHPEEVERLLLSLPGVRNARVFAKSSPIMGALVAADIVSTQPQADAVRFRGDIKARLEGQVEPYKIPVILNLVDHIETTATGKVARGVTA